MTFFNPPKVQIRQAEFDAASDVLRNCAPLRRKQAFPYLIALYSFINWWENDANWDWLSDDDSDQNVPESSSFPWELNLSTTWCERPEIVELINVADLNLQDVKLSLYPSNAQNRLVIHCPTLLSMIQADLCVGVRLEAEQAQATILGFISMPDLIGQWQKQPPNPQGFFQLSATALESAQLLPQKVYQLQLNRAQFPSSFQTASAEDSPVLGRKSNLNFVTSPATLNPDKVAQVLEKLSEIGVSPFAVKDWDQQTALTILKDPALCQKVLGIHHLIKGFQSYSERAAVSVAPAADES
jgi:hypothetical protein